MKSEQQYIDLYTTCAEMINTHSAPVMNRLREAAFADFKRLSLSHAQGRALQIYRHCQACLNPTTG